MQKVFLYLYPLKDYIEAEISYERATDENRAYMIDTLNNLVELRYRRQGYTVYWLTFGRLENVREAEIERIHPGVKISPEDTVISK